MKNKGLPTHAFQNKLQTHPPKPVEAKPSLRKVIDNLLCKTRHAFHLLTSTLESFGHNLLLHFTNVPNHCSYHKHITTCKYNIVVNLNTL